MGRVFLQPAFVLHSRHYGDSSLLVDVLARDFGRVTLLAKGHRSRKKRGQSLQPFTELLVSWSGKAELKTLTSVESNGLAPHLVGRMLYAALYVNEILVRLLPKFDAHPELFRDYQHFLTDLNSLEKLEATLRVFEFRLIAELGYAIDLKSEAQNHNQIQSNSLYRYVVDQGFFVAEKNAQDDRTLFSGDDLLAIGEGDFSTIEMRRAAKRLTRLALAPHLGSKPLKSRELFLQTNPSK